MSGNDIEIVITSRDESARGEEEAKARSKATAKSIEDDQKKIGDASAKTSKQVAGDFKGEGDAASAMDKMVGDATADAKKSLGGLGDESEKTGAKVKDGFEESGKASTDFDRLLRSHLQDDESALQTTSKAVDDLKLKVIGLKREFAQNGNQSILGDLKKSETDLKTLQGLLDKMLVDVKAEGAKAGKGITDGILNGVEDAGPLMEGIISPEGALIAAGLAAPIMGILGAAVADAITVGVGFGMLGAGAVIEHNNPILVASFGRLKSDIGAEMKGAADPLVKPFDEAIHTIDGFMKSEASDFKGIFTALAPAVAPLVADLDGLVHEILPAMVGIAQNFTDVLASPEAQGEVANLEHDFGALFENIAGNKEMVADFFTFLMTVLTGVTDLLRGAVAIGSVLDNVFHFATWITGADYLAAAYGKLTGKTDGFAGSAMAAAIAAAAAGGAAKAAGGDAANSADDWADLIKQIGDVPATADRAAGALADKLLGSVMATQLGVLHFDEALTSLSKALADNKDQLNIHKKAGQDDREAILDVVKANIAAYDANIAAGMSAQMAADKYDNNTAALEKTLHKAGLAPAVIAGLIGAYKKVPGEVATDIALNHLTDAINGLDKLMAKINGIPDNVPIDITYSNSHDSRSPAEHKTTPKKAPKAPPPSKAGHSHDNLAFAHGGTLGSGSHVVGESGWEEIDMPGAMVHSHADSASRAASHAPAGPMRFELSISDAHAADGLFATAFAKAIRMGLVSLKLKNDGKTVGVG